MTIHQAPEPPSRLERATNWLFRQWPYNKRLSSLEPAKDGQVGGTYLLTADLVEGEEVWHRFIASRLEDRFKPINGVLFVTTRRILFCPYKLNLGRSEGTKAWSLADVKNVRHESFARALSDSALRRRLLIDIGEDTERFIIMGVRRKARLIDEAIRSAGNDEES
jgi:hypothetical protein